VSVPCLDANELAQLADGTLRDPERARVEAHLDACAACGELVVELAWSIAPDREPPPGYRIVARTGTGRYTAIGPSDERLELCVVAPDQDVEPLEAFVGTSVPHVVVVRALLRAGDAHWAALGPTAATGRTLAAWCDALAGTRELHRRGIVLGGISDHSVRVDAGGGGCIDPVRAAPPPACYLAPERLHGAPPSRAADQFALCVGLWAAATGRVPYDGATPGALAVAMQLPPRTPERGDRRLLRVLARGLAFDPARRWPDLDVLAAKLAGVPRRRAWWFRRC